MVDPCLLSVTLADEFLRVSVYGIFIRVQRVETCLELLTDDQIWTRRHEVENAVGNLVLHLCGNIRQWVVGGIGGQRVVRDRETEFAMREPVSADELARRFRAVAGEAVAVLKGLTSADLAKSRRIQNYDVTVLHAIYHVVEHLAEHSGQIIWATKGLTGRDLGFYEYLVDRDRGESHFP